MNPEDFLGIFQTEKRTAKPVGVLLSGGLDSGVLVGVLLDHGLRVQPFHVKSDLCWQEEESVAVGAYLARLRCPSLEPLVVLEMPMADLYRDHWSVTRRDPPAAGTADEAVFLPGRNALLVVKVAVWCQLNGVQTLALASLASNPFADTSDSFFSDLASAINLAGTPAVRLVAPLRQWTKSHVLRLGHKYPLHLTFSCIAPVQGIHCGQCNKCAERRDAFRSAGIRDSTNYADAGNDRDWVGTRENTDAVRQLDNTDLPAR